MCENEYQENLHFIVSHPEVVAREMTGRAEKIADRDATIARLEKALSQIARMKVTPDGPTNAITLAAAIKIAKETTDG